MGYKEEFIEIYNECIKREGAKELLGWLENTDFFTAPASTKYHCAVESGLVMHSLNVYRILKKLCEEQGEKYSPETIALCGLLHDVCKADFYTISYRNQKNEKGIWEKVPYYAVDDRFPYGHGEKSVFLIERHLRLSEEEAVAIRWHMGGFDESVRAGGFTMSHAFENYRLPVLLHIADLEATYLFEK